MDKHDKPDKCEMCGRKGLYFWKTCKKAPRLKWLKKQIKSL